MFVNIRDMNRDDVDRYLEQHHASGYAKRLYGNIDSAMVSAHPNLLRTVLDYVPGVTIEQALRIMDIVLDTCDGCHDQSRVHCNCMRDE